MNDYEIRVAKNCPHCGTRLFDRVSLAMGFVEIKCPQCRHRVRIDLSARMSRPRYDRLCYSGAWPRV